MGATDQGRHRPDRPQPRLHRLVTKAQLIQHIGEHRAVQPFGHEIQQLGINRR